MMEMTSGEGADIVVDCGGTSSSLQQAMEMVRGGNIWHAMGLRADGNPRQPEDPRATGLGDDGGLVMLVALHEGKVEWQPANFVWKMARVKATMGGSMVDALALMQAGKIKT